MERLNLNSKEFKKIAGVFVLLILYFIGFTHYGSSLFSTLFDSNDVFEEGTVIGSQSVAELTKVEAVRTLEEKVSNWQQTAVLNFEFVEKKTTVSNSIVAFQIEESVNEAASGQNNELKTVVSPAALQEELSRKMPALDTDILDLDTLAADVADIADYLKTGESVIDLTLYVNEESKSKVLAQVKEEPATESLQAFVKANPALVIQKDASLSFNKWIESTGASLEEESMNILSSAFYELIMKTNFDILEKNQSIKLPDAIELGYEAKVNAAEGHDFIFLNQNQVSYTVNWSVQDGQLRGMLKGIPFYYTYTPVFRNEEKLNPKTVLHFSSELAYGLTQVEQYGTTGIMIDVFRRSLEGQQARSEEQIAADFYPPVHQIELHSSQEPPPPPPEEPEETEAETTEADESEGNSAEESEEAETEAEADESESDSEENSAAEDSAEEESESGEQVDESSTEESEEASTEKM